MSVRAQGAKDKTKLNEILTYIYIYANIFVNALIFFLLFCIVRRIFVFLLAFTEIS